MALSANTTITLRNVLGQSSDSLAIKTSSVVYKGAHVVAVDAGTSCLPAANTATTIYLGIAKSGPLTGDGTVTCEYIYNVEALVVSSSITAGNIGILLHCKDDQTVVETATLGPRCGVMVAYEATNSIWMWVRNGAQMAKAS